MTKLHTLTVPDMLWINLQITGAPQAYAFATLEEGTFYQFGHGPSRDIAGQAARFLTGFVRLRPIERGCAATAFVGCLSFLELNGHCLKLDDHEALEWSEARFKDPKGARQAIAERLDADNGGENHHVLDAHDAVRSVLDRFPSTVAALAEGETAVA